MKFEIINPSDKAYIEGDFKSCCLATTLFGQGKYALRQVDGELQMPIFAFGGSPDVWFIDTFGDILQTVFETANMVDVANALLSVNLPKERTSMNDFSAYAHKLGNQILAAEKEMK